MDLNCEQIAEKDIEVRTLPLLKGKRISEEILPYTSEIGESEFLFLILYI